METIKVGDRLNYLFGGPGPDITQIEVLEVDGNIAKCRDLNFDFELQIDITKSKLWPITGNIHM